MSSLPEEDQARLFYLSILLIAFLGAVLYQYRGRIGTALQHMAIWALIIVGLILAYGFRDQIALQFNAGRPQMIDNRTVQLRRGYDGHFHAEIEVEGVKVNFMVDTGASEIVLAPRDARRVGIDLDRLVYSQRSQTANGEVRGAIVTLREMRLGRFRDLNVRAVVNEVGLPHSLLGMRYLNRFGSISIEGEWLTLRR
ncbi:MAG: TIGR02281 family clan AA aspartic protease [Alphaproteobacteria bacterium]|nr:MAG: TIGR02281 family clan AA aspartic protease [Alphaproteobacteria bacterium]